MAQREYIGCRRRLRQFLPHATLERLARESGFVRRGRKMKVPEFFWSLVLGFADGERRTLAGLRRGYLRTVSRPVARSSFYDRFTPALVRFLRATLEEAIQKTAVREGQKMAGVLARFRDVLLADSTVIRLHDFLSSVYPGCRTNHSPAAAKLYLVMGVQAKGPATVKIKPQRLHDRRLLRIGPWIAGRLLLIDLGFHCYRLFANVIRHRGFFVSRLKKNANPRIVAVHLRHRGRAIDLVDKRLSEVRHRLQRQVLDVEVEVNCRRREYRGVRHSDTLRLRLVGVLDAATQEYHFYLTNVPPCDLTAEQIGHLYAVRWEIELVFRELKRCYRIDQIPSRKRAVVEGLLYAALLTLVVSRELREAARERLSDPCATLPTERWAHVFASAAPLILVVLLSTLPHARDLARKLESGLLREAIDPNRTRALLLTRSTDAASRCAEPAA